LGHNQVNTKRSWDNRAFLEKRTFVINHYVMTMQDKKIVVAGGTSGIGLATAHRFMQLGGDVTVTGRNAEKVRAAEQQKLKAVVLDSRERPALDRFFAERGVVDHLVIAAGSGKGLGEFATLSLGELREGFDAKFWPHLETLQAALPFLSVGGSVTLVTACSSAAKLPGTSGLGAMNGALEIMVPILARELKTIRINAVSPGVVDTPWWDFIPKENRKGAFEQFTANIPVGREAQPGEVADAIIFLAGNAYMTGQVIFCDGGIS
jgi:NAD(P)-dependent dehydrogenase (short-subunit alcohol dehydrogenase family)